MKAVNKSMEKNFANGLKNRTKDESNEVRALKNDYVVIGRLAMRRPWRDELDEAHA